MTNEQLYLAIGVPAAFNALVTTLAFTLLSSRVGDLAARVSRLEDRFDDRMNNVIGALNELDKRVTKIEIKLGIEP